MRVRLLGGFGVSVGDRTVAEQGWRRRKAAGLVKLLALSGGHRLHRDRIMAALWPELDARSAANNLHRTLHYARAALEPENPMAASRYLELRGDLLALCPDGPLWIDAVAFDEAANTARRIGEPAAYRAAIDLYAGDLLPADLYEAWTEEAREKLRETLLALLLELAAAHEKREEYDPAMEALERAVDVAPTREEAHAGIMRLRALLGDRQEALLQYERLERALLRGLGSGPSPATRRLRDRIASGGYPEDPVTPAGTELSGRRASLLRHNLRAPLTSFVGRRRLLVEVKRDLAMTRLLTLSGAGGSGKTRLALEVARDLVALYGDGVWFAGLAPLPDPQLVGGAVAKAFGVREQPGQPLIQTLVAHLRNRQTLLVLDNCEHVVEAAADLADELLGSCPSLRVLATSREPLGVPGEVVRPVSPLAVPGEDETPNAEDLMLTEAVRLFVDRARSRAPDLRVTAENASAVARVCRKLDGLPLAIELAAARMGAMTVEEVADRLEGALGLLTGGGRTVEARHRTLRAALDWSHDLLEEPERVLFRRLSVFAGGWTLEAAERVGSGGPGTDDVLDLLGRLVDRSLVVAETGEDGGSRYRLLEPVRQYSDERLRESREAARVREAHAAYFTALVEGDAQEAEERQVIDPRPLAWYRRVEAEHDNVLAALSWSLYADPGGRAAALGLRMAAGLFWYWHAHQVEGLRYLKQAAAVTGGDPSLTRGRARALHGASWLANYLEDPQAAKSLVESAVGLYREAGDEEGLSIGLVHLGMTAVLNGIGDIPLPAVLQELAERRPKIENRTTLAYLLMLEGLAAVGAGDPETAAERHGESLVLLRETGDTQGLMSCLVNLAAIGIVRGDLTEVPGLLREAIRLGRETDMKSIVQHAIFGFACVAADRGQPARAARLWGAVERVREEFGLYITPVGLALTDYEGRLARARSLLDPGPWSGAWEEGRAMPLARAAEYALSPELTPPPEPAEVRARNGDETPTTHLTRREREVARLVGEGLTNRQIAARLSISEHTAANHVRRILSKLGLRSRAQIPS